MSNSSSTATAAKPAENVKKESIIETFMGGARKGWNTGINLIMPAMVLGYVLVEAFKLTGLMDVLATVFATIMGVFGLPGEAVTVLISAFFAKAAGAATALNLYSTGVLTAAQATICIVPCMLMGTLVGHYARIVLVSETNPKHTLMMFAVPLFDSAVGMIILRIILTATGKM